MDEENNEKIITTEASEDGHDLISIQNQVSDLQEEITQDPQVALGLLREEVIQDARDDAIAYTNTDQEKVDTAIEKQSFWKMLLALFAGPLKKKFAQALTMITDDIDDFHDYSDLEEALENGDYEHTTTQRQSKLRTAWKSSKPGAIMHAARGLTKIHHHRYPTHKQHVQFVKQLAPGDVILINKSNEGLNHDGKIADGLLERTADGYGLGHVMMVVSVDPLQFTHSTGARETTSGDGSEIVDGYAYMKRYSGAYTSLRPRYPGPVREGIHTHAQQLATTRGVGYSSTSALFDHFGFSDSDTKKQNCGEWVAHIMTTVDDRNAPLQGEATPEDFLTYRHLFHPPTGVWVC